MTRKNYFISKGMQSKFAGTILLLVFLIAVISACNIYVLASFFMSNQATISQEQTVEKMMSSFLVDFWPRLLLLVMVNVIIIFIVSIMYSHQIAGPAYKLEKSLQRIAAGDLTFEIHLRRHDNLKEVASAINHMLAEFRETLASAKMLSEDVATKIKAFDKDERLAPLAKSAVALQERISKFKIEKSADEEETSGHHSQRG